MTYDLRRQHVNFTWYFTGVYIISKNIFTSYVRLCKCTVRRGALGCIRNRKTEEKIVQNRKTAKKFAQNRKPHTLSKPIRYTNTNTNLIKVFFVFHVTPSGVWKTRIANSE